MKEAPSPTFFFRNDQTVSTLAIAAVAELGIGFIEELSRRRRKGFGLASTIVVAAGIHPFGRLTFPSFQAAIVHTYLSTCHRTIAAEAYQSGNIVAAAVRNLPPFVAGTSFIAENQASFEIGK